MNNHKSLTKLAVITALLLGIGTFSANTNIQTVSAARTHHRKRARTRHRKGKYIKDFCVYHVRKGVKGYTTYDLDTDDDDFKYELTDPIYYPINHKNGASIVAPTNSHTKYELKTITSNGKRVNARPIIFNYGDTITGGWVSEKQFHKLFTRGGHIHTQDPDGPFSMTGHKLYGSTHIIYHNDFVKSTSAKKLYGNTKRKQEIDVLAEIQNEHLDASGKWADEYSDKETNAHEVARINKALKKLGYSDSLIDKIWKFQRYRLDYTDVDVPDLINENTGESKFLLD